MSPPKPGGKFAFPSIGGRFFAPRKHGSVKDLKGTTEIAACFSPIDTQAIGQGVVMAPCGMEVAMFKGLMIATAFAGGLLMMTTVGTAQALPVAKSDVSTSTSLILVGGHGRGGGGGIRIGGGGGRGGGGFAMRGGGGGGGRGGGFAIQHGGGGGGRGGDFAVRRGGGGDFAVRRGGRGPYVGDLRRGPRLDRNAGGPRYSERTFRTYKGDRGRKYGEDSRKRRDGRKHRRSRAYVYYGVPFYGYYGGYAYYDDDSCDWLYRRAVQTGLPYWWDRYHACLDAYYY